MSTLNVWTLFNMILRLTLGFGLPNVAMWVWGWCGGVCWGACVYGVRAMFRSLINISLRCSRA